MKIVFFNGTADYWRYYLENANTSFDVELVFGRCIFTKSKFLRALNKIHWNQHINKWLPLPFKNIWFSKMVPLKKDFADKVTFLFYTNYLASPPFDPKLFIIYLRRHFNCRIALMYGNTVESEGRFFDNAGLCPLVDLVCSYNTEDSGKYNIKIYPPLLFDLNISNIPLAKRTIDVFFIGQEKGRGDDINKIFNSLTELGLKCEFYIVGKTTSPRVEGIHYSEWLPYNFVVEKLRHSKCILNLLWGGSNGITLRDIEAFNNGCYILKNYVDDSLFDFLSREQILSVSDINQELAEIIHNTESAFPKKREKKTFDVFYKWIVDNSWNN